ncbi:MAG: restriction endonuclease subunit S, partial [Ruminococcus sp.]|nr:restriction endonuclease subunit S [Ruminococcus sp.]
IILYPVAEINSAYYNLLFDTREFADEFYKWGHGIVDDLWTTTWQDMKKIKIIVPPIEEQQKIARFLDEKCGYIDNITELLKKQIELLADYKKSLITETVTQGFNKNVNMKDSGVNYIGKMPVDWKLTKLKYICKKLNRNFDSFAEHLICSNGGKVIKRDINNNIGLISDNEKMYQGVQKGDLLIHGMDTWHGAIAISEYNGKCTNVVHVCNSEENKHFICYFLQMLAFRNVYKSLCNGVRENTSDFRSWEKTGNIYITLPPAEEQEEISAFLDKKCENIDNIISAKKQQLQIMEDYKKSLVYECVTGKRKV